jgi:ArsR family transcriptional regulator, arsenate/arsenite/antimonite-responsive transcriptional repressor
MPGLPAVAEYADMFSAMGTAPRLRIMELLLSTHPEGLVVSEIQEELGIPHSTLSHHLDQLRTEDLVEVKREGTFLRYTANTALHVGVVYERDASNGCQAGRQAKIWRS